MEEDKIKKFIFRFLDKQYGDVIKNEKPNDFDYYVYMKPGSNIALFSISTDGERLKFRAQVRNDIMSFFNVGVFEAAEFFVEWIKNRFSLDFMYADATYPEDGYPSIFLLP